MSGEALSSAAQVQAGTWDEPAGAASPRGWRITSGTVVGFYLDYGPEHYRGRHEYCHPERLCRECEPGNVLAVRYPDGPCTEASSRYCVTVADARAFVSGHGEVL